MKNVNKKMVEVVCANGLCGKTFERYNGEYNRRVRLGKKQYCSLSCYGQCEGKKVLDNLPIETKIKYRNNFLNPAFREKICSKRDKFTPFRYFFRNVNKYAREERNKPNIDITLEFLASLWEAQDGICTVSGIKLKLPHGVVGWRDKDSTPFNRASLDRIDSSKPYSQGNVRFVSYMANVAKNSGNDSDLIYFCNAVASKNRSKNIYDDYCI